MPNAREGVPEDSGSYATEYAHSEKRSREDPHQREQQHRPWRIGDEQYVRKRCLAEIHPNIRDDTFRAQQFTSKGSDGTKEDSEIHAESDATGSELEWRILSAGRHRHHNRL